MKRVMITAVSVCILFLYCITAEADNARISENYGNIPLSFTANMGRADSGVMFTSRGNGCTMFFTPEGTTFLLSREKEESVAKNAAERSILYEDDPLNGSGQEKEREYFALKLNFVNANPETEIVGEKRLPWNNNYFIGSDPSKWRTNVPNYSKVRLKDIYEGIDLVYYGNKNGIKYDFVVQPGADPGQILLAYDFGYFNDEKLLMINSESEVEVKTPFGNLIECKPYCYQIMNGEKVPVNTEYRIIDPASNKYTFEVASYNTAYPLVIDPELVYSTYLGGEDADYAEDITVDSDGNAYITGRIATGGNTTDFPATAGTFDESFNGESDVIVSKLNATGSALVYSTFLGGSEMDIGRGIAVDADGNVWITGDTFSTDTADSTDFPVTPGAFNESINNEKNDVFVSKLNADGSQLLYSACFGARYYDSSYDIAVDSESNAYIIGNTDRSDFPTTSGAFDKSFENKEAFVCKFNTSGTGLVYSTFLGGNQNDSGWCIAVDAEGNACVTGQTNSDDFPTTPGVLFENNIGSLDVFVVRLNSDGSDLISSTYFGSDGAESAWGIALDAESNVYITGYTNADTFPTTPGSFNESYSRDFDVFVSKLNSTMNELLYSGYIGGDAKDRAEGIAVDILGNAYITGYTRSIDFPVTHDALQSSVSSNEDHAFMCKLNAGGSELLYSTYFNDKSSFGLDISVDYSGNAYVAGRTSYEFPTTPGALVEEKIGSSDIFVLKMLFEKITIIQPPTNIAVSDVSDDHGHSIMLSWTLSPDDESLTHYNIYRSRNQELTEPVDIESITTLEAIIETEQDSTILITQVLRGLNSFTDTSVPLNNETYYYWIQAVGQSGESEKVAAHVYGGVTSVENVPSEFRLSAPYPNPFNPSTTIRYEIPVNCHVRIIMYDILGREVALLQDETVYAGVHKALWDGSDKHGNLVGSGVYLYKFMAGTYTNQGKVLFLR